MAHRISQVVSHWRRHGTRATARKVLDKLLAPTPVTTPVDPRTHVLRTHRDETPLRIRAMPRTPRRRLNLLCDGLDAKHLFGGTATAFIFGALLAERLDLELRIVTRWTPPEVDRFAQIMAIAGLPELATTLTPTYTFVPYVAADAHLDAADDELYLPLTWWLLAGARTAVDPSRLVYLVQDDERMFYPHNDRRLRCAEMLADPDVTLVVNTRLLFDHFVQSGLPHVARGHWFEPSFPASIYYPRPRPEGRRRFFFYARAKHERNLFCRGFEAVDRAIAEGILDPRAWEICFVGSDLPALSLHGGTPITVYERLPWAEYAALVGTMDLGLSLMDSPHPSYPPLDLAASGAVVVTNRFGTKTDLDRYSRNIVCTNSSVAALVQGIADGVALANDRTRRDANFATQGIGRDWRASFATVLDALERTLPAPRGADAL